MSQTMLNSPVKLDSRRKYAVLGDFEEFAEKLAEVTPPPPPPIPDTVENTDASEFPLEVWEAATMSPDGGAAIIKAYREVRSIRDQYKAQLSTIHASRQAKLAAAMASSPTATSGIKASGPLTDPNGVPTGQTTLASKAGRKGAPYKTIGEGIVEGSMPRKLSRFEQVEREWAANIAAISAQTGRPECEVHMLGAAHEWRQKKEAVDTLERARPLDERLGGEDAYKMSLRGIWERTVPVGGQFSGLVATIRDSPNTNVDHLLRIGRPLDPLTVAPPSGSTLFTHSLNSLRKGNNFVGFSGLNTGMDSGDFSPETGNSVGPLGKLRSHVKAHIALDRLTKGKCPRTLTLRGRDWQQSKLLKLRTEQYAKDISKLYPHNPEMWALAVKGMALETQLEDLALAPIDLSEVEQQLAGTDLTSYEAYMEVKNQREAERRAAFAAEQARLLAEVEAITRAGPQPGPHLELSHAHLQLSTSAPSTSSSSPHMPAMEPSSSTAFASFSLKHPGTAAVYFTWVPQPAVTPPFSTLLAASGSLSSGFHLSKLSGAVLPGETMEFKVAFRPDRPGSFSQQWILSTTPLLPDWTPITVTARGLSIPADITGVERSAVEEDIKHKEKMTKVTAALERILHNVKPVPPPRRLPRRPVDEEAANQAFDRGNATISPPVFYNPVQYAELSAIYLEAVEQYKVSSQPPPEDPNAKKKGGKDAKKDAAQATLPEAPTFPEAWDGSIASIRGVLAELWKQPEPGAAAAAAAGAVEGQVPVAGPFSEAAEALGRRVDAAQELLRSPPDDRVLLRHAMRHMLLGLVDTLVDKFHPIQVDYDKRVEEQERKRAAAAAKAPGGVAPPLPPGAVDDKWLSDKFRTTAKTLLKAGVVPGLDRQRDADRAAAGNELEARLRAVDEEIAGLSDGGFLEEAQWRRFELLRLWVRLGIPPRPPYVL